MSGSDDEGGACGGAPAVPHVFYRDRAEWKDVTPIPSDEGPVPVVSIDYSEQFSDVYDFVRGVISTGEHSRRVLSLTCDAISLNAANYTVWQLRRDVLEALGIPKLLGENGLDKDFEEEFSFCERMIESNQKNYQVWHHQKALVTWAVGYDEMAKTMAVNHKKQLDILFRRELELTKQIIGFDAKNYHAWQHRQWILSVFKDFSKELEYINQLLQYDVRNNSAWNQRYFVFVNLQDFSEEAILKEMDETWNFIRYAFGNESPYSYLRGLINLSGDSKLKLSKEVVNRMKLIMKEIDIGSVPFLALYTEMIDDLLKSDQGDVEMYEEALKIFLNLIENLDPVRSQYWDYMMERFESAHSEKFNKATTPETQ